MTLGLFLQVAQVLLVLLRIKGSESFLIDLLLLILTNNRSKIILMESQLLQICASVDVQDYIVMHDSWDLLWVLYSMRVDCATPAHMWRNLLLSMGAWRQARGIGHGALPSVGLWNVNSDIVSTDL